MRSHCRRPPPLPPRLVFFGAAPAATATVGVSGTHMLTSKRLPLTSTVVERLTFGSASSRSESGALLSDLPPTPVRSSTSSTHFVEWVTAAKSGCFRIARSAGIVVATPFDDEFVECPDRPGDRDVTVAAPHDQLADEVVVVLADLVAGVVARVEADAESVRGEQLRDRAGRREELASGDVLGVDADLDRVAAARGVDLGLGHREFLAGGDTDLPLDEVDVGDHLAHRVLDLEAGVHLEEEELAVLEDELDGAGAVVADGLGGLDSGFAHRLFDTLGKVRGRGFLDELLVAALRRAVSATRSTRSCRACRRPAGSRRGGAR